MTRTPGLGEALAIARLKEDEILKYMESAPPSPSERELLAVWAKLLPAARLELLEIARALGAQASA